MSMINNLLVPTVRFAALGLCLWVGMMCSLYLYIADYIHPANSEKNIGALPGPSQTMPLYDRFAFLEEASQGGSYSAWQGLHQLARQHPQEAIIFASSYPAAFHTPAIMGIPRWDEAAALLRQAQASHQHEADRSRQYLAESLLVLPREELFHLVNALVRQGFDYSWQIEIQPSL